MRTLSQKLEGAKRYVKHPDYKIGLKMLDEFIEDAKKLEAQVKNLTLHSVSNRRELLIAFASELQKIGFNEMDSVEKVVDIYLKSN